MRIVRFIDELGGWCWQFRLVRELERLWYRSRLWRTLSQRTRLGQYRHRPHHLYEVVISNAAIWLRLQASCWSSRQATMFLEARFNGTRYVTADGHRPVTPFRLSECAADIANWDSIADRLPEGWDDKEYTIEGAPYAWCNTQSEGCDCGGGKGRLAEVFCADFGSHGEKAKRARRSENVRERHRIRMMEETIARHDESRREERRKARRAPAHRGEVLEPAKRGEVACDDTGVASLPVEAVNRVNRLVASGFYCSIHGRHHGYGDQALRQTVASLHSACRQLSSWRTEGRAFGMSKMGDIATHWLQMHQSEECAEKSVWGDVDIPSVVYKYIPRGLIGKGAPNSLRATQLLALNDDMECNVTTMFAGEDVDTLGFLAVVQSKLEEHLGTAVPWEALMERSLHYGDLRLSTFVQEYLNPLVGVVSFSTDILVPTMWAHYAGNTGVVVGYDTEALRGLGFELRPVIYSELAPMYIPQAGDTIRLDFVNREHVERELREGRSREGHPILASTELAKFGADWHSLARVLLVKGMSWAYEKEVRLLVDLAGARDTGKKDIDGWPISVVDPPPEAVKEIYGGAKTLDADVERAAQVARGSDRSGLYVGRVSSHAFRIQKGSGSRY